MKKITTQLDKFEKKERLTSDKLNSYSDCLTNDIIFNVNDIINNVLPEFQKSLDSITTRVNALSQQIQSSGGGTYDNISTPQLAVALLLSEVIGVSNDSPYLNNTVDIDWDEYEAYFLLDEQLRLGIRKTYKTSTQSTSTKSESYYGDQILEKLKEYLILSNSDPSVAASVLYTDTSNVSSGSTFTLQYDMANTKYGNDGEPIKMETAPIDGSISSTFDLTWRYGIVALDSDQLNQGADAYGERMTTATKSTNTAYIGNVPTMWEVFQGYRSTFKNRIDGTGDSTTMWFDHRAENENPPTERDFYSFPVNPDLFDALSVDASLWYLQRWLNRGIRILDAGTYKYTCNFRYGNHNQLSFTTWGNNSYDKVDVFDYEKVIKYDHLTNTWKPAVTDSNNTYGGGGIDLGSLVWDHHDTNPGLITINPSIDPILAGICFIIPGENRTGCSQIDWNDFKNNPQSYVDEYVGKTEWPGPMPIKVDEHGDPVLDGEGHQIVVNKRDRINTLAEELYFTSRPIQAIQGSTTTVDEYILENSDIDVNDLTYYDCTLRSYVRLYFGPFVQANDGSGNYTEANRWFMRGPWQYYHAMNYEYSIQLKAGDTLVFLQNPHSDSVYFSAIVSGHIGGTTLNTGLASTQPNVTNWQQIEDANVQLGTVCDILHADKAMLLHRDGSSYYEGGTLTRGSTRYINVPYEDICAVPNMNCDALGYKYYGPSDYSDPSSAEIEYTYELDANDEVVVLPTGAQANSYDYGKIYKYDNEYFIKSADTWNGWTSLNSASLLRKERIGSFENRWNADTQNLIKNKPLSNRLYKRYGGRDYSMWAYHITLDIELSQFRIEPYRYSYIFNGRGNLNYRTES